MLAGAGSRDAFFENRKPNVGANGHLPDIPFTCRVFFAGNPSDTRLISSVANAHPNKDFSHITLP